MKGTQGRFLKIFSVAAILFAVVFLAIVNWQMWQKRAGLEEKIIQLKKEIEEAQKKNEEIRKNIAAIGTENYLEKIAKEQLGMKKSGEEVVVINKETSQVKNNQPQAERNIFRRLWNFIMGQ